MKEQFLVKDKVMLEVATIDEITERITNETSKFVIPEYQRDYVWSNSAVPNLMLSLLKGYPVGSMLLQRTKTSKVKLLDGLQRTFSLVKIKNDPLIHINEEITRYYFKEIFEDQKILKGKIIDRVWDSIYEKIKEFKKSDSKITPNNFYGWMEESEKKNLIKSLIDYIVDWVEFDFPKIMIPQIILTSETTDFEATEIFELINSEGKGLNNFEILSSYWSNFPIKVKGVTFIENFINTRVATFLEKIDSTDKSKIEMSQEEISPSNFIYAIFDKALSANPIIKPVFYNENGLRSKAIISIMSIFANVYGLENIKNESLKKLGPIMQGEITDSKKVNQLVDVISKAIEKLAQSLPIFGYISSKGQNVNVFESLGISVAMITSMINTIIRKESIDGFDPKVDGEYLMDWLIIDTIKDEYITGSSNKAWANLKDMKYLKQPNNNTLSVVLDHINSEYENSVVKSKPSQATILIISMIQNKFGKDDSVSLDVDHIIPKSILSAKSCRKNYINTIGNLQLLDSQVNRTVKNDRVAPEFNQWDFLLNNSKVKISDNTIKEHRFLLESIKKEFYKIDKDGEIVLKKHTIAKQRIDKPVKATKPNYETFIDFYELRYKEIIRLIKETF